MTFSFSVVHCHYTCITLYRNLGDTQIYLYTTIHQLSLLVGPFYMLSAERCIQTCLLNFENLACFQNLLNLLLFLCVFPFNINFCLPLALKRSIGNIFSFQEHCIQYILCSDFDNLYARYLGILSIYIAFLLTCLLTSSGTLALP